MVESSSAPTDRGYTRRVRWAEGPIIASQPERDGSEAVNARYMLSAAASAALAAVAILIDWGAASWAAALPDAMIALAPLASKVLAGMAVMFAAMGYRRRTTGVRRPTSIPIQFTHAEPPEPRGSDATPQMPAPYIVLPYAGADRFTGRVVERQALSDWLRSEQGTAVRVLASPGGSGKSALAWTWLKRDVLDEPLPGVEDDPPEVRKACRIAAHTRPAGVLWWSFDRPGATFSVLLDEALAYFSGGTVGTKSYLSSRSEKVDTLLNLLREGRHLLVLDGIGRELRAFAGLVAAYRGNEFTEDEVGDHRLCADLHAAEFMRRLVAQQMLSRVLITTRLVPAELGDPLEERLAVTELGGLDPADAVTLLQRCGIQGRPAELQAACADRDYHPLAIRLAAGMITRGKDHGKVRDARRRGVPRSGGGDGHPRITEAALAVLDARTEAMLNHVAVIRGPVTVEQAAMFDPHRDGAPISVTLDDLVVRGLLMYDRLSDRYDLHPLVRRAAYLRLNDPEAAHGHLAEHFATAKIPVQITRISELQPAVEQYHHLTRARRFQEAYTLLTGRLLTHIRDRFADQHLLMQLLRGLFDGTRPQLNDKFDRAWVVDSLAKACSYSGETRRAAAICEANLPQFDSSSSHEELVMLLETLAGVQTRLGRLTSAEQNLRRLATLAGSIENEDLEAVARNRLGLLLAHRGMFDEALGELDAAFELVKDHSDRQIPSVSFSYYTQRALLMGDSHAALDAAKKSRAFVEEAARRAEPNEHDYVRSGWLLGAAHVAMAQECADDKQRHLDDAERYLSDALSRCRRNDLVGFGPDLLVTWARWNRLAGKPDLAAKSARDALAIADRCDYRLKKAEAHNFLARLAVESGDKQTAQASAEISWNCADCDGEPYCYKPARDEADKILVELGVKPAPAPDPAPDTEKHTARAA